jgi:6-phosphogluconolactonase (cycloisomerase 2 family)
LVTTAAALAGAGAAQAKFEEPHAVYVATNATDGNKVVRYARANNGKLTETGRYATGGIGARSHATNFPSADSQGAVTISPNGRWLIVTNSGSNSITLFSVRPTGLKRKDVAASGGTAPISSTIRADGLVYVLNEAGAPNVSGLQITPKGKLKAVSGSTTDLIYPKGAPAQVGFDRTGKVIAVSPRMSGPMDDPDFIETYRVGKTGKLKANKPQPSTGQTPFGFVFTSRNHLLMTDAHNDQALLSTLSSYATSATGALTRIDSKRTFQTSACWITITKDDKYVFTSNPLSQSVTAFKVGNGGRLALVTPGGETAKATGGASDVALSLDDRYLYVNAIDLAFLTDPTAGSSINVFKVGSDGSLKMIQEVRSTPVVPASVTGLDAR